jgi:DNA-binding NarL/FixJ family response regulator
MKDDAQQIIEDQEPNEMNASKIKILLVDDQETVLKGLKMRLALEDDFQVIGEAKDGLGALKEVSKTLPDIVVMDVEMPNMDGITAAKALREINPQVAVIILSIYDDPVLRAQAQAAGAFSYVEKRGGAINLIHEIRNAFADRRRFIHG